MEFDDFLVEARQQLEDFERHYKAQHALDPQAYPLKLDSDNSGVWWEQLADHDHTADVFDRK